MTNNQPVVAVVENDFGILKALQRLLSAYGHEAEMYASAELFLERDQTSKVDCLILDMNLDGMSGLDLQKKLVLQGVAPPIIFITGRGDEITMKQAMEMGCLAFLHKPFESSTLQAAIVKALKLSGAAGRADSPES